ncbi:hypothetical protein EKK58_09315 [Candidatus Dependentiae bacterium]|nr:MAG: hypothetical protein EKK58_09315 [Candidatus Dependentiae bacterium]
MFNIENFSKCIRDNLKDRRFGKERADEIIADFEAKAAYHKQAGRTDTDAAVMAMRETFDNLSLVAAEKAKRTAKMLSLQAENIKLANEAINVDLKVFDAGRKKGDKKTSRGTAIGRALVSKIEDDPRFSSISYSTNKEVVRGQLYAIMGDVLQKVGKGKFGVQRGKAHLPNIIREAFGESTGDKTAKEMIDAYFKTTDVGVDLFNQAGGSMRKMKNYLPQPTTSTHKLTSNKEAWIKSRAERWDWDKMRWPDGSKIEPNERAELMETIFETQTLDGANKVDPTAFRGKGRAVGNALDNHRFVHYKDADSWLKDLEEFGDGNVFEVMMQHIEGMAHKIALIDTFGPNPEMTILNMEAIAKNVAGGISAKDKIDLDAVIKNKFRPMMDLVTRTNPMNPESVVGNTVVGISNILTSAQLGSASLLAIPGDFMQSVAVRALNKMDLFGGINYYFKTIATDPKFMSEIAAQSGFIFDDMVMSTYAATRYTGIATVGPHISRRISDTVMRASLMSGHTRAARWAAQSETMGFLHRMKGTEFEELPIAPVMQRYGITAKDWDTFRKLESFSPGKGVNFLRPMDILNSKLADKQGLYKKFQAMVFEESRKMVPESTIEATVSLKGTSRPDTLMGMILHSFAMYKNFPMSFWMIYGRLGMTSKSVKGRLGFYAGLGAGMTMVGAVGTQMREIAQGRDPMPMDNPAFLGKAFLSGGALAVWGDFLFSGVNRSNGGPADVVAGPLAGFAKDTTQLMFGDAFKWANTVGTLDEKNFESNTGSKGVEYLKRYTPGSNIWWARLALERQVWDRLQELADPKAYSRRRRKETNQRKMYGNESWWPAGERSPERMPQYNGE